MRLRWNDMQSHFLNINFLAIWFLMLGVADAQESKPRFALLIGVSEYPGLSAGEQLEGSVNDVALMKETLTSRFGFDEGQITTLIGRDATGDAIRSALDNIVRQVSQLPADYPQAQVVFHFSGHGAQLPDQEDENRDEPDGLDETLVPSDASKQGGDADIRDDELNDFAHDVCDEGKAHLWMVLDCCHSGTGTRGIHKESTPGLTRYRKLDRELNPTISELPMTVKTLPDGVVSLYACRDKELEPEYSDGEKKYGLLTRFLTQVINEQERLDDCTYGILRDSIAARYRQDRTVSYNAPVPQLEGSSEYFQRSVLGSIGQPRPRYWNVKADRSAAVLLSGAFHGMTKGSVFEVYEAPDQVVLDPPQDVTEKQGDSIGWIEIERVDGSTCKANFIDWKDGHAAKQKLPRGFKAGYAVERFHDCDDFDLKLKIVAASDSNNQTPMPLELSDPLIPEVVREALDSARMDGESKWLNLIEDDQPADLLLNIAGERAALFPSTGKPLLTTNNMLSSDPLRGGWGPFDLKSESVVDELRRSIRHITRARNLLRIANFQQSGGKNAIDIEVELLRVPDPKNWGRVQPWPLSNDADGRVPAPLEMKTGDLYKLRVTNREKSGKPIFVSVLHVDSDMGIEQVFPYQEGKGIEGLDAAILRPGQSQIDGPWQCNAEPPLAFGPQTTVVLATREPNDFYMLKQDALPKVRSLGGKSSLRELMLHNAYFKTRATRRRPVSLYDNSWGTATVRWTVIP